MIETRYTIEPIGVIGSELSSREESPPLDSPTGVVERIAEIPTRFKLKSECDRQLLITAAAKVVAQNKQEIDDFLAGRPTQEGTTR